MSEMDLLDRIKRNIDLREYVKKYDIYVNDKGYARCPEHPPDKTPSLQFWEKDGIQRFTDHHDKRQGTIIDFKAWREKTSEDEAVKALIKEFTPQFKANNNSTRYYTYRDLSTRPIRRKVRGPNAGGHKQWGWEYYKDKKWISGGGNYESIPYNLSKINKYTKAIICEGEKDADTVMDIGLDCVAISAPNGKGSWPDSLNKYFKDLEEITFIYDVGNEEDAKKHAKRIQTELPETKIFIAKVPLPNEEDDITDYLQQFNDLDTKKEKMLEILSDREQIEPKVSSVLSLYKKKEERVVPDINNDFLDLYIDSISRVTDAPKIFILFSGIALLSGVLNKFWFNFPDRTQLNLFILLLAPSTYYRKTTVIEFVGRYLDEVDQSLNLPDSFTPEALFEILKKYNRGLIRWRELIQLKEFQLKKDYNQGLPAILTDMYDYKERWKRWTIKHGETILESPIISILAGGVTTWFTENLKALDFQGGLWTRFIFVPAPEEERLYNLPQPFVLNPSVIDKLKRMTDLEVQPIILREVESLMEEWGAKHMEQTLKLESGLLQAMYQRLEVMLLKLASILQLADDQSNVISPEAFSNAMKLIEYLKGELMIFFQEEVQFTAFDKAKARVEKFIRKHGSVMRGKILQGANVSSKWAGDILDELKNEGKIKRTFITPHGGGRRGENIEYIGE